jgi:hypothetical protein
LCFERAIPFYGAIIFALSTKKKNVVAIEKLKLSNFRCQIKVSQNPVTFTAANLLVGGGSRGRYTVKVRPDLLISDFLHGGHATS